MTISKSLISGFAGSLALTLFHQLLKKTVKNAPRMDRLGEQALQNIIAATGADVPTKDQLFGATMAGDIAGNASYYALVGVAPVNPVVSGTVLGLAAGLGAVYLPGPMGLNEEYSNATPKTQVLTVAVYLAGGLIAGLVQNRLKKNEPVYTRAEEAILVH